MAKPANFWDKDVAAADALAGDKASLDRAGKLATIAASQASGASSGVSTATNVAELPFVGPRAQSALTQAQLTPLRELQANIRDELKTFEALEPVKTYGQSMRYFTTALTVPKGRIGDQELVTLAAKVQDPTGAIMQGDIERYNNVQVALERLPQAIRDQFLREGKFSPETRRDIIALMRNRVDTYRLPYDDVRSSFEQRIGGFNEQITPLGLPPISPKQAIGTHPMDLYSKKIEKYDLAQEAENIRKQREAGPPVAGPAGAVPVGSQVAGEDVTGWRFSPEAEAAILAYSRKPEATPEGYAKLAADLAISEKHISPAQREETIASNVASSESFFKQPAQTRAKFKSIDYGDIDRAASENAGLFQSVAQAGQNVPEAMAQIVEGVVALPKDVILSVLTGERAGSIRTMTDLASALLQGDVDDPTVQATATMLEERYGSPAALKRTAITDPLGLVADVSSVLSGAGALASRLPGVAGATGRAVRATGRVLDPLSGAVGLATEGLPAVYSAAQQRTPGMLTGIMNAPSEILAIPSGVGGRALREATGAGFERGRGGVDTARTEAFTEGMRSPETTGESLVTAARDAVANLRAQASQRYTDAMQRFGQTPTPLDINTVQQRVQRIKPRSYDTWSARRTNRPRPAEHLAWEQMNDFVNEYADMARGNPNLLMPLEMDQFKQDLFDVGSRIGGAYDRDASRIAGTAYNAVRQELVRHDPIYADTMRDYERAAREAKQLETSFGLAAARGKQPNVEASARKLQAAIGRNNANVSYGVRAGQAERLNELDPSGTIVPTLAGTVLSAARPRGLNAAAGLTAASGATLTSLATLPMALALAPAFSPRIMGEAAYGLGRMAGTGARGAEALAASPVSRGAATAGRTLADLYERYPSAALAMAQLGSRAEETEQERLERLYGAGGLSLSPPTEMR
jgi:hypothetical protein